MSWGYRPQLDGLRCLAVYLVLLFHAQAVRFGGGFIGVDLFFVLSGFLVTTVIVAEIDERDRFSLGGFYARRVRRLLPAAVLAIAATSLIQLLVATEPTRLAMVRDAQAALLYVANWQFIREANDYFGSGISGSPFLHFWSLSIEEQFYIVYPLVVLVVLVRLRWSRRRLMVLLGALAAVSIVWQVVAAASDVNYAYYATQTRIYQPLVGCVLALLAWELAHRTTGGREVVPQGEGVAGWVGVLAALGVGGVVVLATDLVDVSQSLRGLLSTVGAGAAIVGVVLAPRAPIAWLLSLSWPRYLGQISYGTYLWHWPVILVLGEVFAVRPLLLAALAAAIATGLAAVSFRILETPIRRAKPLARVPWPVVASGLALSVVVAVAVVPLVLRTSTRPALAGGSEQSSQRPVGTGPGWAQLDRPVPDIDFESLADDGTQSGPPCDDGTAASCVAVDGTGPLVVLVGDSHAGMLSGAFRRLAEERGFRFSSAVMSNCPWQRGLVVKRSPQGVQNACAEMRTSFYDDVLPSMDADLVILVSKARSGGRWVRQVAADDAAAHAEETFDQMMQRKAQETVRTIRGTGTRVAIVHSIFGTGGYDIGGFPPLDCLAQATTLADCAVIPPRSAPSIDVGYTALARSTPEVVAADLRPAYCPRPICSPVTDGIVTWHDPNHLSDDFVVHIRDDIWAALEESGALEGLGLD